MKKISIIFTLTLVLILSVPQVIFANMVAPDDPDIGSSVTFEKNDTIAVLSEVLDITVNGSQAHIVATYRMKNTSDKSISTKSMFLSSNIENSDVKVLVNNKDASFTVESYALYYDTEIQTDDWQYAVLTEDEDAYNDGEQTVDSITFEMAFAPNEEYDVVVSYDYRLGGYPNSNSDIKEGEIDYYLKPAAMWKDFSSLTINLYLDKDMPIVKSSNLEFEEIDTRTYRYTSDTLPDENLKIFIDENGWQNFWSSFRNPYFWMAAIMIIPLILFGILVIILIVRRIRKKKRASQK